MLEKVNELAEQAAVNVSRRSFLDCFGKGAVGAALAVGGLLAGSTAARAGRSTRICSADGATACAGKPVGSPCVYNALEGTCFGERVDGGYACVCRTGPPRGGRR